MNEQEFRERLKDSYGDLSFKTDVGRFGGPTQMEPVIHVDTALDEACSYFHEAMEAKDKETTALSAHCETWEQKFYDHIQEGDAEAGRLRAKFGITPDERSLEAQLYAVWEAKDRAMEQVTDAWMRDHEHLEAKDRRIAELEREVAEGDKAVHALTEALPRPSRGEEMTEKIILAHAGVGLFLCMLAYVVYKVEELQIALLACIAILVSLGLVLFFSWCGDTVFRFWGFM
jgi:hypothetical protein